MELTIVKACNQFLLYKIDSITSFVSWIPFLIILWTICAVVSLIFDKKKGKIVFLTALIAIALHFLISEGLFKYLLSHFFLTRTRPYLAHPDQIIPIGKQFVDSSFPSSHMASTLAELFVFVYYYPFVWPFAVLFASFMAFARMHNGMHYPTDILAGAALGLIYGLVAMVIVKKIFNKIKKNK